MTRDFDAVRAAFPDDGLAVYAYEPGAPVVLEVWRNGAPVFTVERPTLAECILAVWPPEPEPPQLAPRVLTLFD